MTTLPIQSIEGRDNIGDLGDTLAVPLYTYNIHLDYIHNIINSFITLVLDNFSVPQE